MTPPLGSVRVSVKPGGGDATIERVAGDAWAFRADMDGMGCVAEGHWVAPGESAVFDWDGQVWTRRAA